MVGNFNFACVDGLILAGNLIDWILIRAYKHSNQSTYDEVNHPFRILYLMNFSVTEC